MPRSHSRAALVAAALALTVSGCSSEAATEVAAPGVTLGAVALTPCGEDRILAGPEMEDEAPPEAAPDDLFRFCGSVPGPDGAPVLIGILSDLAAPDLSQRELLAWHPGGPGISPVEVLLASEAPADLSRFLVLAWDGATASGDPGACGPVTLRFGTTRVSSELAADAAAVAAECHLDDRVERGAAAVELEAVRVALAAPTMSLLTQSYGTVAAEDYLREHPDRVRAAVLDAPLVLDAAWPDRAAATSGALEEVLARVLAACTAGCPETMRPIVGQGWDAVRSAVLAAAAPAGLDLTPLSATQLDQASLVAVRSSQYWAPFLESVAAALDGDATHLAALSEQFFFGLDREVYWRTVCRDLALPADLGSLTAAAADLPHPAPALAQEMAPCLGAGTAPSPTGSLPASPSRAELPVLVLTSSLDVLSPASLLPGSRPLSGYPTCETSVPGHTSAGDTDVAALVTRFLAGADARTVVLDPACRRP